MERILRVLESVRTGSPEFGSCLVSLHSAVYPTTCPSISDDFCARLWSSANKGNLTVFDGTIARGTSPKSGISLTRLEDDRALIEGAGSLPPDLAKRLAPGLESLGKLLKNENSTSLWKKSYAEAKRAIESALESTGRARLLHRHPHLEAADRTEVTTEEAAAAKAIMEEVRDEVLEAKYKNHPNWKRAEKVYGEAKSDLKAAVQELPVSDEQRKLMLERLKSVTISLPYVTPAKGGNSETCGSTERNAYYSPASNKFFVCAGFFNSFQSESVLYGTIAHEIGHAIDPIALARAKCEHDSPLVRALQPINKAESAPFSCEEWEGILATLPPEEAETSPKQWNELEGLYSCLKSREGLQELTPAALGEAAKRLANQTLYSSGIALPLRRNVQSEEVHGSRMVSPTKLFAQAMTCSQEEASASEASPRSVAIGQVYQALQAVNKEWLSYCGQNCRELVPHDLAVNTQENFADWISFQAFRHRLERIQGVDKRREASALFSSDLCSFSAPYALALTQEFQHLAPKRVEDRERRVSIYTEEVSGLLECERDEMDGGFSGCKP
jgi:hypothetical protein